MSKKYKIIIASMTGVLICCVLVLCLMLGSGRFGDSASENKKDQYASEEDDRSKTVVKSKDKKTEDEDTQGDLLADAEDSEPVQIKRTNVANEVSWSEFAGSSKKPAAGSTTEKQPGSTQSGQTDQQGSGSQNQNGGTNNGGLEVQPGDGEDQQPDDNDQSGETESRSEWGPWY